MLLIVFVSAVAGTDASTSAGRCVYTADVISSGADT